MSATHDQVRAMLLGLPGVAEGVGYGSPIFRIGKTMLARFRDDGVMVLKVDAATREVLLDTEPAAYFLEDHYLSYPLVLVRIAEADADRLAMLVERSWTAAAPKRLGGQRKVKSSTRP